MHWKNVWDKVQAACRGYVRETTGSPRGAEAVFPPVPWPVLLLAVLVVAVCVHRPYFANGWFPPGDGGMFAAVLDTMRETGRFLPKTIAYNGFDIPFAYPPLAFIVGSVFMRLFDVSAVTAQSFLPPTMYVCVLAAYISFVGSVTRDGIARLFAVVCFSCTSASFFWIVMGGGLTRSFGFFFFLLLLVSYLRNRGWRRVVFCGALLGLVFLSHPEFSVAAVVCTAALWLLDGKDRPSVFSMAAVFGIGCCMAGVWLSQVVAMHGLSVYGEAFGAGLYSFVGRCKNFLYPFSMILYPVPLWVFVVGGLILLIGENALVPTLFIVSNFIPARNYTTISAVMGSVLVGVVFSFAVRLYCKSPSFLRSGRTTRQVVFFGLASCLLYVFVQYQCEYYDGLPVVKVTSEQLASMDRLKSLFNHGDAFLIVDDYSRHWGDQFIGEWFPYLTGLRNIGAAQGLEWVSLREFSKRLWFGTAINSALRSNNDNAFDAMRTASMLPAYIAVFSSKASRDAKEVFMNRHGWFVVYDDGCCQVFSPRKPA